MILNQLIRKISSKIPVYAVDCTFQRDAYVPQQLFVSEWVDSDYLWRVVRSIEFSKTRVTIVVAGHQPPQHEPIYLLQLLPLLDISTIDIRTQFASSDSCTGIVERVVFYQNSIDCYVK